MPLYCHTKGMILHLHCLNEPVWRAPGDAQCGGYPVQTLMVMAINPDLVRGKNASDA